MIGRSYGVHGCLVTWSMIGDPTWNWLKTLNPFVGAKRMGNVKLTQRLIVNLIVKDNDWDFILNARKDLSLDLPTNQKLTKIRHSI